MSFIDEALPILRVLIGDDESPYTYCDTRLSDILYATAKLIILDLSFDNSYTVTISTQIIDPDPTEDPYFIPLVALKAAVKVAGSEYKAAAASSGSVVDGPSTISLAGLAPAYKARLEALQKDYDKARLQYSVGNAIGMQAVMDVYIEVYSRCYENKCFNYDRYRSGCY